MELLDQTAHRPWPLPESPWIQEQRWNDLLFAHWPISRESVRVHLPIGLELDTFGGDAWLSITPFTIDGLRVRGLPTIPGVTTFPEIDIRTYVVAGGKPGVYYFRMHIPNPIAVLMGRIGYGLPFVPARVSVKRVGEAVDAHLLHTDERGAETEFSAMYHPGSVSAIASPGTLEHWLTERYAVYVADGHGHLHRGNIHRLPLPLQTATMELRRNSMPAAVGLHPSNLPPLLHYASTTLVLFFPLERVDAP